MSALFRDRQSNNKICWTVSDDLCTRVYIIKLFKSGVLYVNDV